MAPPVDVQIRPATPDDLDALAHQGAALVRFHHELDPARFMLSEGLEKGYRRFLESELKNTSAVLIVATAPDLEGLAGYAYGRIEPRDWTTLRDVHGALHDVFVSPSARRRGVAERLVKGMVDALKSRGAPTVMLMSAWDNTPAQRVFARLGFRRTMVEMTLDLSAPNADEEAPATTHDPSPPVTR